jgi:hypothetical protein
MPTWWLGGHYHLYITRLDRLSMMAAGYELSGASTSEDGEWLLNLLRIEHMLSTFGPACESVPLELDEDFEPARASAVFGGG